MKNLRKTALRKGFWKTAKAHKRKAAEAPEAEPAAEAAEAAEAEPAAEAAEAPPAEAPEAEPAAEGAEPLWPAAGVKVAVGKEHILHCLRLGETGVSQGPAPDDDDEVVVKLNSKAVLAPMRIPRSLLVPVGAPMTAMRYWDKCSEQLKRQLLHKAGVRDPRDEVLPSTASVRLTMWGEYLPYGLGLDEGCKCKFVQPAFVKALGDADELQAFEDLNLDEVADFDKRQRLRYDLLEGWWVQNEVLLVCVCDEASASSALLAVRKTPPSLRYYEAGARGNEAMTKHLRLVLGRCGGVPDEVPDPINCTSAVTEDLIAHYIEGEFREARGETRGCLGYAANRLKKV